MILDLYLDGSIPGPNPTYVEYEGEKKRVRVQYKVNQNHPKSCCQLCSLSREDWVLSALMLFCLLIPY